MQGLRGRLHLQDRTLVPKLEGRAETLASMFNAQDLANTLCVLWLVSQDSLCASASQGLEAAREQSYEGHKGVQCGERERASEIA